MTVPLRPVKRDDILLGWRQWIAQNERLVSELMSQGCTRGEALLMLQFNEVEQGFQDLGSVLHSLVQELDDLCQALDRPDGEDWKGSSS